MSNEAKKDSPLLTVSDLSVRFHQNTVVEGVNLKIHKGETLALVGESGSGKSVTALSVMQLLPYPTASHPAGSIRFLNEELVGASHADLRHIRGDRVSMIFQEPMTSLNPLHTIEKQIGEMLYLHRGMDIQQARERIVELLELVGLPKARDRLQAYPHELSGGQRQRVMIAMALANEPDLLIADEPTTALDVTIQAQILGLLKELQQKLGMAILMITHDLGIVHKLAHRVAVMQDGRLVEQGDIDMVFNNPQHAYTRSLLEAEPTGHKSGVAHSAPILLQADNLRVWFPIKQGLLQRTIDNIKAVDDIDLEVREGQTIGIVGESGSGKTTLGMALLRLQDSKGSISFAGDEIQSLKRKNLRPLRRQMQIVFQDPFGSLSPRMSVAQIIGEGLSVHDICPDPQQREQLIIDTLIEVGLDPDSRHRYPHEFSGGQRQRISIARAMILKPRLVVLDEPTSALDRTVQSQIIDLLRDMQQQHNLTYLFISHDLAVVRAMSDEIIVMKNGQVVERGATEKIVNSPEQAYTRELMAAAFELDSLMERP
ncbi:MAG: ABC transporter ATP-binding protein [Gammaproteobacteria bacterium]|nr:ABC transporter ATP-binding protein [Gammaproteobacteria bacterium]